VARVGERSCAYRVFGWKREGKDHLEDLGVDGRMILIYILRHKMVRGLSLCDSGQGHAADCYECGNEPLGFTKYWEFLD
jgi:hypothetical protein